MWHCPSCGAPQAETARCWVCRRSSTTCSTCTHFRPALAGDLGYCGRDAKRTPLTGLELRGCWEPRPAGPDVSVLTKVLDEAASVRRARAPVPAYRPDDGTSTRDFVPVESVTATGPRPGRGRDAARSPGAGARRGGEPPDTATTTPVVIEPNPGAAGWVERTTLFGDPEG